MVVQTMSEENNSDVTRIMVDIETLGLDVGSAILSIGAVEFDKHNTYDEFYEEICLESNQKKGMDMDASTLTWWLSQDVEAQQILTGGRRFGRVLSEFHMWLMQYDDPIEVWANSPAFDCQHLEHAFDKLDITLRWDYYETRDVQAIKEVFGIEKEMDGQEHHALDDAKHQVKVVQEALQDI